MPFALRLVVHALNGNRLVMQATPPLGTPPRKQPTVLTVDGQIVAGAEDATVLGTWFSPDGKRYAVLCQRFSPVQGTFMIVDVKKELSYQTIWASDPYQPSFSPDSSKFLYVATATNGQTFVVVDGEESDGVQGIRTNPVWSPTGSRLAWGGVTVAQKQLFYLDGKLTPHPKNAQPGATFSFSPDGARTSWASGNPGAMTLIVDGVEIPGVAGLGFVGVEGVDGQNAMLRFSPNGKHTASKARDATNLAKDGMWVDGKLITPSTLPQMNRVTFTPDSQHVAWAGRGRHADVARRRRRHAQALPDSSACGLERRVDARRGRWGRSTSLGLAVCDCAKKWRRCSRRLSPCAQSLPLDCGLVVMRQDMTSSLVPKPKNRTLSSAA